MSVIWVQVNLPGKTVADLCHAVSNDLLERHMFDAAAAQMIALMESNSLFRFLSTSPPAWEQFLVQIKANDLMTDKKFSLTNVDNDNAPRVSVSIGLS